MGCFLTEAPFGVDHQTCDLEDWIFDVDYQAFYLEGRIFENVEEGSIIRNRPQPVKLPPASEVDLASEVASSK